MSKTLTYDVAAGAKAEIKVRSVCSSVTVGENLSAGTQDLKFYGADGLTPVTYAAGRAKTFPCPAPGRLWLVDEILGYVEPTAGSVTIAQEEE